MKKLVLLTVASVVASVVQGADLLEVYQEAELNDARYLSATYQRSASALQPALARSARNLTVNLNGSVNAQRESVDSGGNHSSDSYLSESISLTASKTLFDRQSANTVSQANLQDQQADYTLASAKDDLVLRVANAYFALLGAQDNLDLATSEKIAIKRQLELADERLNVGIGTQTDLFDARARFQIAEANEIEAGNLIEDARQNLVQIIASDPGGINPLKADAPLEMPVPADVGTWVANAMDNNPQVISQQLGLDISRLEIDSQKALRSPSISLNASQSFSNNGGGVNSGGSSSDRDATQLGLQLTLPLYLGGAIPARIEQAGLNANAQEQNLIQTRRQIERQVRDVYNDVVTGIKRVQALQQAVVAGESAVEAKNEGFAAGLITNLDVLDAQRDLYQAQRDYLRARYDFILSVLGLEQAAGQLDIEDVRRVNTWLN